ncbi:hypothetical protein GCM10007887_05220 [Methylobacterium haplocladii]|uniref:Uncharacterized protein n=1 Tax=Methylobacterium haplocladii TaxID=1176176 RepID=A0A512IJV6_9HYPH|nr:hypothetical protein MHA02_03530 [Methylobacterium haplocladii]GLS57866.1 hypothetical protein GCM10007887_05220 [Methylobacterium haplocladii]
MALSTITGTTSGAAAASIASADQLQARLASSPMATTRPACTHRSDGLGARRMMRKLSLVVTGRDVREGSVVRRAIILRER